VVEPLIPPDAPWRSYLPAWERRRIRATVARALLDLRPFGYQARWTGPSTLTVTVPDGAQQVIDASGLLLALSNTGLWGHALRARALGELGDLLSTALPPDLVQPELADPELAPARLLASAYAQADGARRAATEREFVRRLKRLTAEEALRLAGQLPEGSASLLPSVARQVALAVVQDTAS